MGQPGPGSSHTNTRSEGMGCVVTNSVEAAGVLVGVPARRRADLERIHTHCHK